MDKQEKKWLVKYWMTKNPQAIPPESSVQDAFIKMRRENYRHLLIVDNNKLLGIVTDRDLRRPNISDDCAGWDDFYEIDSREVRSIMSVDLKTITEETHLQEAAKILIMNKIGSLPVVDENNKVIGILTERDILIAFYESMYFGELKT